MKAVVFHGVGDVRIEDVPSPVIEQSTDAVVRIATSAICGTDLHMVRGTMPGMKAGTILGHEGVGIVEQLGEDVRNVDIGDRVVIPSTIACGNCPNCRKGEFAQCDNANPQGKDAGTAFFGGPEKAGAIPGMQAELVRVPFANVNLVKIPDEVTDDQAILISDIFPTGYFGAELACIQPGDTVAVFGCGPVGQFAILSAKLMDAGRVLAIDKHPDRLAMARAQGAEVIDYEEEDPVEAVKRLTQGMGADAVIDAVGVDAERPHRGPAKGTADQSSGTDEQEVEQVSSHQADTEREQWKAGDAPSQVLRWAVEVAAKCGRVAIIGVYPPTATAFPIGRSMGKNLTIRMGNCPHLRYIPKLLRMVRTGMVDPEKILTKREEFASAIQAFKSFDQREAGWIKVGLAVRSAPSPHPTANRPTKHERQRPTERQSGGSRPAPHAPKDAERPPPASST